MHATRLAIGPGETETRHGYAARRDLPMRVRVGSFKAMTWRFCHELAGTAPMFMRLG